jgi:uncharacterized membrane protein
MSQTPPPPPPAAPPPPPSTPGPASGGGASFNIGDAVGYGWNALMKNLGPMILITLVIVAVNVVLSIIAFPFDNAFMRLIINLIGWIVGMVLAMGLIRASLAVTAGRTPEVSMLFETENLGPYIVASILFSIGLFIGLVLCIVPGIFFAVVFAFFGYVIVERGEQSPIDALKRAAQITEGHRGSLFGLFVVLFLINVVGALLCGIGLLFTYPLTAITVAWAYRTLSGEPVAPVT